MSEQPRNPGPSWGYAFMNRVDRALPRPLMGLLVDLGSLVGMLAMKEQRRHSRAYLETALGRRPTWRDSWRHFAAFGRFLLDRFRAASGEEPVFEASDASQDRVEQLANAGEQALYGSFHFGQSDMMGFWLSRFPLSVRMVRFQVGNSADIEWLDRRFGGKVGFIWVNEPENMLFALKEAVAEGHSIAIKCDRTEHSSKTETFAFLGQRRRFPFTIYHLSILFGLPVVFAFGVKRADGVIEVHSSSVYRPEAGNKRANLAAAKEHFAGTLVLLESLLTRYPYQWFNFMDALPVAED